MRANAVAGSLLVSSVLDGYFTPVCCELIEQYAELLSLVFDSHEFYDARYILLGAIPPIEAQRTTIDTFRQRVVEMMLQASRSQRPITTLQAEAIVWQQIEKELLNSYLPPA
jgi:hypothetical protein